MEASAKRDAFLREQSARFEDDLKTLTLVKVVHGGGWDGMLALFLLGQRGAYLVAAPSDPTIFGIPLPNKEPGLVPDPWRFPRDQVTKMAHVKAKSWWGRLWEPREVVAFLAGPNAETWTVQLFSSARSFVNEWSTLWGRPAPQSERPKARRKRPKPTKD